MPINYSKYPENWRDTIRPDIMKREGYKCKFCRVPQRAKGYRDNTGRFIECDQFEIQHRDRKNLRVFTIYLQIAHLDHDIKNNDYSNLAALCQQCHNRYDRQHRNANRKIKYNEK